MKLHTKIMLGLALGAAAGVGANAFAADATWVHWTADNLAQPVGQIFLRMLLMTVVPLVFASLTLGVAGIGDIRHVGRLGAKTMGYFLLSTGIAVVIGLTLINMINPGSSLDPATRASLLADYGSQAQGILERPASFGLQTFINIVPRNPVGSAADMDMLGVIFFSVVFGAALTVIPTEKAQPMLRVIDALGDVVIKIIDFAMRLAPYGVFGLVFVVTSRFGFHVLEALGRYVLVVVVGLLIHAVIAQSLLVKFLGGWRPLEFWKRVRPVIVTAFSTSSSAATLPTSIAVAEHDLEIEPKVAGFVLPLGATMNMNGTALYEGMTVLFLATVFGIHLSLGNQVVVVLLSVLTAIGAAGVPGGSLPLMIVVMGAVGVPAEGIAIILGVDRLLDMCRTTINVTGDLTAAAFVARSERGAAPFTPSLPS